MASRGDLALCLDTWLSASLATPGAMRNIIVNRCMNTDGIRTHRELSGHLALKKCEPEVLNYHLVRFDIFFCKREFEASDTHTHAHTRSYIKLKFSFERVVVSICMFMCMCI